MDADELVHFTNYEVRKMKNKKEADYIYCEDLDEVCDWVNHNFEVIERRMAKAEKTEQRKGTITTILIGIIFYKLHKLTNAIENLEIKCGKI